MAAGQLYINSTDAFTEWGVSLEPEGVDALMAFAPNKEPIVNKNPTSDGAEVVATTVGRTDARTVTLLMHIVASGREDFIRKRTAFYNAVRAGALTVVYASDKRYIDGENRMVEHTMYYVDCHQYTQFVSGLAKFALSLYEPNPQSTPAATL